VERVYIASMKDFDCHQASHMTISKCWFLVPGSWFLVPVDQIRFVSKKELNIIMYSCNALFVGIPV
jgi:hypothetical protein